MLARAVRRWQWYPRRGSNTRPAVRNELSKNSKDQQDKQLQHDEEPAYSPAYRAIGQDLAHLVAVWPKLAEPLKKAILAIVAASETGK